MAYDAGTSGASYGLTLVNREILTLTGVSDVDSFDDQELILRTIGGTMQVRGEGLHVDNLDLERGAVSLRGRVDAIEYTDDEPKGGSFFSRIFR